MKQFIPLSLRERHFRRFMAGYALSLISRSMVPVVVTFALFEAGRGVGAVSVALASETVPLVILMLLGGVVADKFPRRNVMACANLLCFCSQAVLAALFFTHHAPLWAIAGLMACIGSGSAFFAPGLSGLIPELVPEPHLQSANSINSMAQSIGNVAGPALGGLLVAVAGGSLAIAIDSVSYLICAAILASLPKQEAKPQNNENMWVLLKEGWQEFSSRKWMWTLTLQSAVLFLLVIGPLFVLGPLMFSHQAHGALGWGGLLSISGAGSILGSMLATRCKPRYPLRFAILVLFSYALLPASLAAHVPYFLMCLCAILCGVTLPIFGVLWNTLVQTKIPQDKISRVIAYDYVGSLSTEPLGYALAAPLAYFLSPAGALWLGAAVLVVSNIAVLMVKAVWNLQAEPEKTKSP